MKVRLPVTLKERIEEAARAGNRSLNGEILLRLERSFEGSGGVDTGERVSALETEIETLRAELRQHGARLKAIESK